MEITVKLEDGEDIRKAGLLLEKVISNEIEYKVDGWVTIHVVVE